MNPTIAQKLERFLAGESPTHTELEADQARALRIRLHRSAWATMLAEPGAACASARLAPNGELAFIGTASYINDGGYVKGRVFIGRYCSIGRRVSIGASHHRMVGLSTSPVFRDASGSNYADLSRALFGRDTVERPSGQPTIIEHDVWIGDGAIVAEGVRLRTGAVIGANAVVTRDVEPYRVVQGPSTEARRFRFPPEIIARLLATEWWEASVESLRQLPARHVLETLTALETRPLAAVELASFRQRPPT